MPTDVELIPQPVLDARTEEERIAARIHRSVGNLTVEDAQLGIDTYESLKAMLEETGEVDDPLLPEFTSANPASAHTVLLTQTERALTETIYRLNQVPDSVRIAELRLNGVTLLPAVAATTTLLFTKTDDYAAIEVIIPEGTEVQSADRSLRVRTNVELVIADDELSGTVQATAFEEGYISTKKANTIGTLIDSIAGIRSVTNTTVLSGGADAESIQQGEIRAREEKRIGQHLGTKDDWQDHIYFRILRKKGRVTAFENYRSDFTVAGLGYLLLVVQGEDGLAVAPALLDIINDVIDARHIIGIMVSARQPDFVEFDLTIKVRIGVGQSAATLKAKAESNLRARFNPLTFEYGQQFPTRYISLSDIIGQVENAAPNLIDVVFENNQSQITITIDDEDYQSDVTLSLGQMPLLGTVTFVTA
jgi:hypothetical protein